MAETTVMLLVVASRAACPKAGTAVQFASELRATSLESGVAAGRFREPRHESQAIRLSPKTHGSPKACAVVASSKAVPSARLRNGGGALLPKQ